MEISLSQAYQLFMADRETSCVPETLTFYSENLQTFFGYCEDCFCRQREEIMCSEVTRELFTNYIVYLRKRPKYKKHPFLEPSQETLSNTTIRTYARAIRAFSNYCYDNDFGSNFTKKVKLPKGDPREIIPLYASEVKMIDKQFNLETEHGLRNWCIVHLMLDAGLRSSEVIELRFSDLIFEKNIIRVFRGKGGKTRLVVMCPRIKKYILRYCVLYRDYEKLPEDTQVFIQMKSREPINENVIKQMFSRLKKKSGVDRIHPHLLRHTFATSYIKGGGNIEMLRLLLGHFDYEVTKMYLHLAQESYLLKSDIYRLDPVFFEKNY